MNLPSYLLDGGQAGRERLRVVTSAMRSMTRSFIQTLRVANGMRCLDLGCGGGDVTRELAGYCFPDGVVVGVDADSDILAIALAESQAEVHKNIEWICADATTFVANEPFDVVYARFLLTHVPESQALLRRMVSLTKPGGIVAVEDVWFPGHFCWPACEAFDTYVDWYIKTAISKGGDPYIGIKLPEMFERAGLTDISFTIKTQSFREGADKSLTLITLERIANAVLESGIATEAEFNAVRDALRAYTFDTSTTLSMAPVMQITGRVR